MPQVQRMLQPNRHAECHRCHSRGLIVIRLESATFFCLPCLRKLFPGTYRDLANWVQDHKPAKLITP